MIQVNLFRISANQEYLEFILDCPEDYRFNKLMLKQYDYTPTSDIDSGWRDLSSIFDPETDSSRVIARMKIIDPSTDFTAPTIFYASIGVTWIGEGDEQPDDNGEYLSELDTAVACSNVSWVYENNLSMVMSMDVLNIADGQYKAISRNYVTTQAHLEAMRLERFDEAEKLYDLLKKIYA
jgi:hypothetical protein